MNLGRSIAYLLKHYPTVYVPGIGVFSKQFVSATSSADNATVYPPQSVISLAVGAVTGFDVTNFIQAQQATDAPRALVLLSQEVAALFAQMKDADHAVLDDLGKLSLEGDVLKFEQAQAPELVWPPVETIFPKEEAIIPQEAEEVPVVPVADVPVAPLAAELETDEAMETDPVSVRRNRGWWWVAAILLLLTSFTVALWIFNPQQAQKWYAHLKIYMPGMASPGQPSSLVPVLDTESEINLLEEEAFQDTVSVDSLSAVGAIPDSVEALPAVAPQPAVVYEIIVGSFVTMEQAERFVAEMKAKGYSLKAMDSKMPGNRKKISWGSFPTKEAADRELVKVKREFEPEAWIARIEN